MTRKAQKLLEKARRASAGWKPRELITLYKGFGFVVRSGKGSHKNISHPKLPHLREVVPEKQELDRIYVKRAVQLIEELLRYEEGDGNDG